MNNNIKFYKTKMTLEIEVSTQMGPYSAVDIIRNLTNIPAIQSVDIVGLETDYIEQSEQDVNFQVICNVPFKLK